MVWFLVAQIFSTLISLIQIGRMAESEKDLEIMVLRYQLGIAERKLQKPVRANRVEKMTLAVTLGCQTEEVLLWKMMDNSRLFSWGLIR